MVTLQVITSAVLACTLLLGCSSEHDGLTGLPDAGLDMGVDLVHEPPPEATTPDPPLDPPIEPRPDCPEPNPDSEPGSCFEIGGPSGISHDPPRQGDIGFVEIGNTIHTGVGFYNFCGDYDGLNVGTYFIDTGEFINSTAYRIISAPEPCSLIPEIDWDIDLDFRPLEPGFHRVAFRYEVTHGHYDFEMFAEAVEPGGVPIPLETRCIVFDEVLEFLGGRPGRTQSDSPHYSMTCSIPFGEAHLVFISGHITDDADGAFELPYDIAGRVISPLVPGEDWVFFPVTFTPPTEGLFEAELVMTTNEPIAEHRVLLTGTTL